MTDTRTKLLGLWRRLAPLPGGAWLFSQHLDSVHAIALMNLAEITSGLAMMAGLAPTVRGIVTNLSMTYHKKARGTIRAVARVAIPTVSEDRDFDVMAECFDREGTLVATGNVRWRLGLARPKAG